MDPIIKGEKLISIWDKFEELFGRKVDLLSRTQVRNPYLQKGIDATKQLIYEAWIKEIPFRNRLIHAYNNLEDEIIWAIINRHIPKLKEEIIVLLNMD